MLHEAFRPTNRGRLAVAGLLAAGAGLVALVSQVDPAGSNLYPRCHFHELTGFHCPGCGATRAVYQLAHGRALEALRLNAVLVLLAPWGLYELASDARFVAVGRGLPEFRLGRFGFRILIAVFAVFWVARNIPAEPFRRLAP